MAKHCKVGNDITCKNHPALSQVARAAVPPSTAPNITDRATSTASGAFHFGTIAPCVSTTPNTTAGPTSTASGIVDASTVGNGKGSAKAGTTSKKINVASNRKSNPKTAAATIATLASTRTRRNTTK